MDLHVLPIPTAWILVPGVWRDSNTPGTERGAYGQTCALCRWATVWAAGVLNSQHTATLPLGAHYEDMIQ